MVMSGMFLKRVESSRFSFLLENSQTLCSFVKIIWMNKTYKNHKPLLVTELNFLLGFLSRELGLIPR